jgi:hypothetical protein
MQDAQCNTLRGIPAPFTNCEDGTKGNINAFTLEKLKPFGPLFPFSAHKQTKPLTIRGGGGDDGEKEEGGEGWGRWNL